MKLVQSTWFNNYDHVKGNWPEERFALFSMALSYHLLKKQHLPTRLNTNGIGFDIIVNMLGLEYDEVDICLEKNRFDPQTSQLFDKYWSLHKLYAYSLQEEPFIHFDNDVYFYKKLDDSWKSAELVAQNKEFGLSYYTICLEEIQHHFTRIPRYLDIDPQSVMAVNAGVAGGTRFDFFKQLYREVILFLTDNQSHLESLTDGFGNIFIEQCFMKKYADSLGIPFKYILPNTVGPSKEYRANKFHLLPDKVDYIHVMNYKSNATTCESIAKMLYHTNRSLYQHCVQVAGSLQGRHQPVHKPKSSDPLSNDVSAKLRYFFRRTNRICELLSDTPLPFSSIELLSEAIYLIGKSMPGNYFEVLLDVFVFELDRYRFFMALNADLVANIYRNFNTYCDASFENDWKEYTISMTDTVKLLESRWNWVEGNEFTEIPPNYYLNNTKLPPGHFATLIYYYPEQNIPKEHPLKICDRLIIQLSKNDILITELTDLVHQSWEERDKIVFSENYIEERIRFLVFQGVFAITKQIN